MSRGSKITIFKDVWMVHLFKLTFKLSKALRVFPRNFRSLFLLRSGALGCPTKSIGRLSSFRSAEFWFHKSGFGLFTNQADLSLVGSQFLGWEFD